MKVDVYTKIILTVIAVFLGILVLQNTTLITPAKANPVASPQSALSGRGVIDVNVVQIDGAAVSRLVGLPVNVKNTALPIEMSGFNTLPVEVKNSSIPVKFTGYGAFPVEVKNRSIEVSVSNYRDFK